MVTGEQVHSKREFIYKRGCLLYYQGKTLKLKVDILDKGIRYNYKGETIIELLSYEADMLFMETCIPKGFNIQE